MEDVRFSYCVKPRRPIKNIGDISVIRTPKTLKLTLDEVLQCIPCGPVYRRFVNENRNERVTSTNAARLHNEKYMTEEEYEAFLAGGNTVAVNDNLNTVEEVVEKPESLPVEEAAPVEDELPQPDAVVEDHDNTTEVETVQETIADEKVDSADDTSATDALGVSEEESVEVVSDSVDESIVANAEEETVNNEEASEHKEDNSNSLLEENAIDDAEVVESSIEEALENTDTEVKPHVSTTTINFNKNNNNGGKKKNKNRN